MDEFLYVTFCILFHINTIFCQLHPRQAGNKIEVYTNVFQPTNDTDAVLYSRLPLVAHLIQCPTVAVSVVGVSTKTPSALALSQASMPVGSLTLSGFGG
jgi:hypothetical protein